MARAAWRGRTDVELSSSSSTAGDDLRRTRPGRYRSCASAWRHGGDQKSWLRAGAAPAARPLPLRRRLPARAGIRCATPRASASRTVPRRTCGAVGPWELAAAFVARRRATAARSETAPSCARREQRRPRTPPRDGASSRAATGDNGAAQAASATSCATSVGEVPTRIPPPRAPPSSPRRSRTSRR